MGRVQGATPRRAGFTLVEVLVTIAIVAVLASLLLVAVGRVVRAGEDAKARNDLSQLSVAIESFKAKYGVYPPDQITLKSAYANTIPDNLQYAKLKNIWPRIPRTGINLGSIPDGINLTGAQCLVFFLMGPTGEGFSSNSSQPFSGVGTVLPQADLPSARLKPPSTLGISGWSDAVVYVDVYGKQPILYFATQVNNDYGVDSNGVGIPNPVTAGLVVDPEDNYPNTGDPAHGNVKIQPYKLTATKFANSHTFQLICAGHDCSFGPGGLWTPGTSFWAATTAGHDDITNFASGILGADQ